MRRNYGFLNISHLQSHWLKQTLKINLQVNQLHIMSKYFSLHPNIIELLISGENADIAKTQTVFRKIQIFSRSSLAKV